MPMDSLSPTSDVNALLDRAQKKFNELDVSLNGTLEGDELLQLAEWVFDSFHPDGQPMSVEQRQAEADKLLRRLDKNDDAELDFEEFSGWFERTCHSVSKFEASHQPSAGKDAPPSESSAQSESRTRKLKDIFNMFDLNGSGRIDRRELAELTKARRALGQKAGEWTQEQNQKLLSAIERNVDGTISAKEFIEYFSSSIDPEHFDATMVAFSAVARSCSLQKLPPQTSPRQLFVTTPGRSPRAMMPAGSKANTVLNAARGIFDAANKTQNDVLEIEEIRFLARQVWQIRGSTEYDEVALAQQVEKALVTYGTGEQFVTFMQFLRMVTKHPWHLLLPSELQTQLGVKSPSKGLPITPRERLSPQPGNSPPRHSPSRQDSGPLLHDDLNLSEAKAARLTPTSVPPLQVGVIQDAGGNMQKLLPKIREMFDWLDQDRSGALERDELLNLAEWVFENFHPDGENLSEKQRQEEADKLLKRLDKNEDRRLSFEEFEGWCKRIVASIVAFNAKHPNRNTANLGSSQAWAYTDQEVPKDGKSGAKPWSMDTYKARVHVDIGDSVNAWNAAAGSVHLVYKAAAQLFEKYDADQSAVLSPEQLVEMVKVELWEKRKTPLPKVKEAEIRQQAHKVIGEVDFLGAGGIAFPAFVRMIVCVQPWVNLLSKSAKGELTSLVKSGVLKLRINPRRETGAKPTVSGAAHQVVRRVMGAVEQLFDQISGSPTALIDKPKMQAYLTHFFGDELKNPDQFTASVMIMCDRIVQGGLCKADFTRVVIREPFCAILPPAILEDVYYLIDLAMQRGGGAPLNAPQEITAASPEQPLIVKPPSDQIHESDAHVEQARRELCRAAQAGGLQTVFGHFDSDNNGYIDGREFIALAHQLAKKMVLDPRGRLSESDARAAVYAIIKRIDVNCDGRVSFKEFEDFVTAFEPKKQDPMQGDPLQGADALAGNARQDKLREVFKAFDINSDGTIGGDELLQLGQARRRLGQKQGEWTAEMNRRMLARMDGDGDGRIVINEFVTFFDDLLPRDMHEFDNNIKQFMDVAASVRLTAGQANKREPIPDEQEKSVPAMTLAQTNARVDMLLMKKHRTTEETRELRQLEATLSDRVARINNATSNPSNPAPQEIPTQARAPRRYREPEMPDREKKLREVFQAFDIDGDGAIGAEELLVLGQQRRKLGQKSGEWTKEMNTRLMKKLDRNGDGQVLVREFVDFFDEQLPSLNSMFYHHCDAFLQVAQSLGKASVPAVEPAPAAGKGRARAMQEAIKNIASKEDLEDRRAAERRIMQNPSLPTQLDEPAEPVAHKDWSAAKQAGETFYKIGEEAAKPVREQPLESPGQAQVDLSASARAEAILYGRDELTSQRGGAAAKTLSAAERAEAILYGTGESSEWDVHGDRSVSASPEFQREVDDEFDHWDENQDGVIDRDEFTRMRIAVAHKEAERIRSEARSMSRSMSKSRSPAGRGGKLGAMNNAILRADDDEF